MAISTSFSTFFPFLSPQTKPQPQLPLLSPFPSHHNHNRNRITTLVLTRNETSSSVTSSPPPPPPPQDSSSDFTSSFSNSNLVFTKSTYNVQVFPEDDESYDRLFERFGREVMRAGIIQECRRRKFFENTQDEKKRRDRDTAKRNRRLKFPRRPMGGKPGGWYNNYDREDEPKPVEVEDDDNWDLLDEDVIRF